MRRWYLRARPVAPRLPRARRPTRPQAQIPRPGDYHVRELLGTSVLVTRDREGRARAGLRNFQLFDAPHVAFIGMSKEFRTTVALDVGMYVQTLMLLMAANGIGSCPMGSLRNYPDIVREEFGVPDDVGAAVVWLMSDDASFITGELLEVGGGS